ncbi:MAG: hypothetical protein CVV25_00880 [Ignavibacteriae bacterium HGW-Ignavibacteriae-4]|jgi:hypothetical protein|nr:MAG: hypothetical protein CVV25_00880 [Ignavibacteriae bacterium HGW-Ignavibacteriae-4]
MNKLLTIFIFLAMTGLVEAKDLNKVQQVQIQLKIDPNVNETEFENPTFSSNNNSTQDIEGKQIGSFQRFWYAHFASTTPISYDPTTEAVVVLVTDYVLKPEFNGTKVFLLRTTNKGSSWDSINIYRDLFKSPLWGSISLNNPTKSTDITDVSYAAAFQKVWKDTVYDQAEGSIFAIYDKSFGVDPEYIEEVSPGFGNPPDAQTWGNISMKTNEATNTVYGYGTLIPPTSNDQYGYYGYWRFDFTEQYNYGSIPSQWWANKFRLTESKGSTFNAPMEMVNDEVGTLYAAVNNRHFENSEPRLLGISKSLDNGDTWSDFEIMPDNILNSILDNHPGYTQVGVLNTYGKNALFCRGIGKVTYLANIIIIGADLPSLAFLTELTYDNGVFGIKEITELETGGPTTTNKEPTDPFNPNVYTIRYTTSRHGNNIQVAKTVDGDKVLAMWIDAEKDKLIPIDPVQVTTSRTSSLTGQPEDVVITLDTILKYDIYASVYDMKNGNWSKPVNITNDDSVDTYFNIPPIIPSVTKVPFLSYKAMRSTRTNQFNFPREIIQMLVDDNTIMRYTELDATKEQPKGPVNSVKEVLDFNVELGNAYPNPAVNTNQVGITFTIDELAVVTLELFDNLGNKVETIFNDKSTIGYKAINANISNLNSGTYYYQLSVNGVTFTKKLVIVK